MDRRLAVAESFRGGWHSKCGLARTHFSLPVGLRTQPRPIGRSVSRTVSALKDPSALAFSPNSNESPVAAQRNVRAPSPDAIRDSADSVAAVTEKRTPAAGALHVLIFAFLLSLVGIFTQLALAGGGNTVTVVAFRTLGVLALTGVFLRFTGVPLRLPSRDRNLSLALGLLLAVNNYSITRSIELVPVPLMVLVFYTYPVMTSLASWITGTERFSVRGALAVLLAMAGLALALQTDFSGQNALGIGFAVLGAISWSAMLLLTGHYFRGSDPRSRTLYMNITVAVVFVVACALSEVAFPNTPLGWFGLATLPLAFAIGIIGLLVAAASLGPMKSAFYMNFEPVVSILLSALILDQRLAPIQLAGAALVIVALFLFRPLPTRTQ
jgi:drug/metabolite transporter (DMT)-like permease